MSCSRSRSPLRPTHCPVTPSVVLGGGGPIPRTPNPEIRLTVKTLRGNEVELVTSPYLMVEMFKWRLHKVWGIPPYQQRLIFKGYELDGWKTLLDFKVVDGSVLNLVIALRGGGSHGDKTGCNDNEISESERAIASFLMSRVNEPKVQIFVKTLSGKTITLDIKLSDTVELLKNRIEECEGTSDVEQHLVVEGKHLEDDDCFVTEYGIQAGSTVHMVNVISSDEND